MNQNDIDKLRGHDFLPTDLSGVPMLYSDSASSIAATMIHLRFFTNAGSAYWLLAELDPETGIAYGYAEVIPGCGEWGSFSIHELRELYVEKQGFPIIVERDLHFTPKPFSEIKLP